MTQQVCTNHSVSWVFHQDVLAWHLYAPVIIPEPFALWVCRAPRVHSQRPAFSRCAAMVFKDVRQGDAVECGLAQMHDRWREASQVG